MENKKAYCQKKTGLRMITLGLLLIAAALFLVFYNFYDTRRAGRTASEIINKLNLYFSTETASSDSKEDMEQGSLTGEEEITVPDYILNPNMEMPVKAINGVDYIGILRIPALELELPIISEWSYPGLKAAPCRYSGSAYLNNLIICGHNYTSHFGNLANLHEGDIATFTDMDGNEFTYVMVERQTLPSYSAKAMESGDWDLTLFTCTISGQSRITVRFELEEQG